MTELGFIGTGTMGGPMAANLLSAGHEMHVHDRSTAAVEPLVAAGAVAAGSPRAVAEAVDIVLLSLPGPDEVGDAVAGFDGILAATSRPAYVVDLSTNSPTGVADAARRCADVGITFVDAPVSGGVARAVQGTLAVLVGGTAADVVALGDVLRAIGSDVMHVGPTGAGTVAKLVNNQLFLAAGLAVQEAYVLGAALGMGSDDVHRVIASSSAAPYTRLAPLLLGRRFDDVIFRLDIAAKDLRLAAVAAEAAGADLPLSRAAADLYAAAVDHGDGQLVFHASLRELERRAGIEVAALAPPPRAERPA